MSDAQDKKDAHEATPAAATAAAATGAAATPAAAAKPAPAAGPPLPLLLVAALVPLVGGLALGAFVLGPKLKPASTSATAAATEGKAKAEAPEKEKGKGKGKEPKGKPSYFKVADVIVNPAGAQGSHFLMASVAFEVANEEVVNRLHDREIQIRDIVITNLERLSIDDLQKPGIRDSVKSRLEVAIAPIAGPDAHMNVYLPQFVIQ